MANSFKRCANEKTSEIPDRISPRSGHHARDRAPPARALAATKVKFAPPIANRNHPREDSSLSLSRARGPIHRAKPKPKPKPNQAAGMAFVTGASLRLHAAPPAWATGAASRAPRRAAASRGRARPSRAARMSGGGRASADADAAPAAAEAGAGVGLLAFLADAGGLGTVRFVCVSAGAVLESVGRFDYGVSLFSTPRGDYVTLASADRTFEAHVNVSVARAVTMSTEKAKVGGHDLHVIRLLDAGGAPLLSCLLMWDPSQGPGHYLHGAVPEFQRLRDKYGERFDLA